MQDKMDFRFNLKSQAQQVFYLLALVMIAWIVTFWQGIITAVDIWLISDIFNHCLFVLPGSFYLIYLKRQELSLAQVKPAWWALVFCAGSALLYLIGIAGDVQLFMHAATFSFLPFAIWACVGNSIAKKILFPLFFMLFCIPFGEELIPALQEITADLAVMMLNWTTIPIFRSGLYIEIPAGRFLVAEACSGISFFIASVVIGSLYSYLNIYSTKRRIWFVTLSIFVPIIANAVRVFGIIVIAYLSNMEYAVGADHLIYGWFFFAFVIILLLGIGELIREKHAPVVTANKEIEKKNSAVHRSNYVPMLLSFIVMYSSLFAWTASIISARVNNEEPPLLHTTMIQPLVVPSSSSDWVPKFTDAYEVYTAAIKPEKESLDLFIAWYPSGHGELISSLHRLYQEKEWTLESSADFALNSTQRLPLNIIVNAQGYRVLTYWYVVDGKVFTDKKSAKLYEIYLILIGKHLGGGVIILSEDFDPASKELDIKNFSLSTEKVFSQLNELLNYNHD